MGFEVINERRMKVNAELKRHKRTLRTFMRQHYTDAKLVELLQHARSGQLAYFSCCCFVGIPTANHELQPEGLYETVRHYRRAKELPGAMEAEFAYCCLGGSNPEPIANPQRRRRLIPIILAEMRRRSRAQESVDTSLSPLVVNA